MLSHPEFTLLYFFELRFLRPINFSLPVYFLVFLLGHSRTDKK